MLGVAVMAAIGGWFVALTTSVSVLLALAPRLSVTVAVSVNVPATLYVCEAEVALTGALPSPKLIVLATIVPSTSVDPAVEAVIVTGGAKGPVKGAAPVGPFKLRAAIGG